MPLIDPKPSAAERDRATREAITEAIRGLPIAALCDAIEAEISDRAEAGLSADDAARITKMSNEVGRIAWPDLAP